jgi:nucleoside 2-deoxyribosyltransferase
MMPKVFLSFDARDADLAKDLAKKLTEAGVEVVSPPAMEVRPGEDLLATVESRMRKCDEVAVLLTVNSVAAPGVVMEMGAAYGMHKPVIPISLGVDDNSLVKDLPYVRYADIERYVEDLRKRALVSVDTKVFMSFLVLEIIRKFLEVEGKPRVSSSQLSKIVPKALTWLSESRPKAYFTGLGWRPYLYGPIPQLEPHSPAVRGVLQDLLKEGYIEIQTKQVPHGVQLTDEGRAFASIVEKNFPPDVEKKITRFLEQPLKVQRKRERPKRAHD